ncbi:hypothetical protein ACH9DO_03615 [Kocuria sp. M1N1S27]|uniref:hypothetical protein n=1 Tax=Kocuria kalidii TaxID=3376283 RepID=UPI00378FB378
MSDVPGFDEADRLEQTIDAERPEMDDQDAEAPAQAPERSEASSLEANPDDLVEQDQEVVLDEPEETSTLEEE